MKKKAKVHEEVISPEEHAIELIAEVLCENMREKKPHTEAIEGYIKNVHLKIFVNSENLSKRCKLGYRALQEELEGI